MLIRNSSKSISLGLIGILVYQGHTHGGIVRVDVVVRVSLADGFVGVINCTIDLWGSSTRSSIVFSLVSACRAIIRCFGDRSDVAVVIVCISDSNY